MIKCDNCKFFKNGCPLGNSNDFCFPVFIECLYNNFFKKEEIENIKEICDNRFLYKEGNISTIEVYKIFDRIAQKNRYLNTPGQITAYALTYLSMSEIVTILPLYESTDLSISEIMPWEALKEKSKKIYIINRQNRKQPVY
ncbi:MAG TPA: hypothetical protein PKJ33_03990 [Alphaproteobacteria bacterium]|nr:hypothetical protein [Alphaproteobacteria bacterium]